MKDTVWRMKALLMDKKIFGVIAVEWQEDLPSPQKAARASQWASLPRNLKCLILWIRHWKNSRTKGRSQFKIRCLLNWIAKMKIVRPQNRMILLVRHKIVLTCLIKAQKYVRKTRVRMKNWSQRISSKLLKRQRWPLQLSRIPSWFKTAISQSPRVPAIVKSARLKRRLCHS